MRKIGLVSFINVTKKSLWQILLLLSLLVATGCNATVTDNLKRMKGATSLTAEEKASDAAAQEYLAKYIVEHDLRIAGVPIRYGTKEYHQLMLGIAKGISEESELLKSAEQDQIDINSYAVHYVWPDGLEKEDSVAELIPVVPVDEQSLGMLANGYADFAFDLYRQRAEEEKGNIVFSPLSIASAFSMVYAGAQGETETQLMNGFHFLPQGEHHPNFEALIKRLNLNSTSQVEQTDGTPFQLVIANAVWGQEQFSFKQPYLDLLANSYQAPLQRVDFAQPQADRINNWIAEQTHGKITDLVSQDILTADTRLVLANAIYLKGSWLIPFDKSKTKNEQFHLSDGGVVDVPMMQSGTTLRTGYLKGDGYQVVQLPYVGASADMLVILPDEEKFDQLVTQLNGSWLSQAISQFQQHDVNLKMPRFDIDQKLPLEEALKKLGVVDAFDEGTADFSNMADSGLYVSAALHQTTLVVNEEGSEATAATVVAMAESAFPKAEMIMDRPFLFAIVDRQTSTIFFLGQVVNPSQ